MVLSSVFYRGAAITAIAVVALTLEPARAGAADAVDIPDPALASCIRDALELPADASLTSTELAALEALECDGSVSTLEGLQHANHLLALHIEPASQITDIAPLAALPQLEYLSLPGLGATDISAVASLSTLVWLDLYAGALTTLPSFAALPDLAVLDIGATDVEDLSPLADAHALEALYADETLVEDVSPLAQLASLTVVDLAYAWVEDLSPLAGHPSLAFLDVDGNAVRNASALGAMPALEEFSARDQFIDGAPVTRCVPFTPAQIVGPAGSVLSATASNAYRFGPQTMFLPYGQSVLRFDDGDAFSGQIDHVASSGPTACAWPASLSATVTVSGTSKVGQTLTASLTTANAPAGLTPSFTWEDAGTGQYLGWGTTYTPGVTHMGLRPRAVATIWLPGMVEKEIRGSASAAVLGALPASPTITFTNPAVVGTTPHVTVTGLSSVDTQPSFKTVWKIDGTTVATTDWDRTTTYQLPASARGKTLSVSVSVRAAGYETRTYTGPSTTVLGSLGTVRTTSDFTGTFAAGSTVSIKAPTYGVTPSASTYQWRRDGKAITGATGSSYRLTTADAGHKISVAITAKRSGYLSSTWVSHSRTAAKVFTTAPAPKVTGSPTVGSTLTASAGTWSPTPGSVTYRWYRDGTSISGATSRSYKATTADIGHKITVKATATRTGYSAMSKTSASVTVWRRLVAPTPTITGTAKAGSTLTVKRGTWGPGTVTTKVQWYVNGKAVSGSTASTYKVRPADAYKSITVKVVGTKSGYTSATRTSAVKKSVGIDYASCTDMRKHYPHGVAKSSSVRDMIGTRVGGPITTSTFVSASLYALNDESDRDKDGWACEP
ncbi:excalibur calcium-binding domain-containing protein [Demequina muriae]|uniref:Excalibur calcium-binding domain-containing protein n=1 Tax=Demequina muriae TaxID=3051664 RepID=A0ABT8GHI3_9MICO|nr:excalibur calcium-binding domain-containing protein [Demequina sp. EGI L300058]MDN4480726.1 excalibur calcium-binding domain-containing protein [Demequina sp. EGI L300058]